MSFLSTIFGAKKNHTSLVIHDGNLEALQIIQQGKELTLIGVGHLPLKKGVVERGGVQNKSQFPEVLQELFSGAHPQPIQSNHLNINIPFEQIYSFLKVFSSYSKEENMQTSLTELIQAQSPFAMDELIVDYQRKSNEKIIYSALAYSKAWKKPIEEACNELGINNPNFIAEPIAQLASSDLSIVGNFALLSWQEDKIFLTLFCDGVLYDNFALKVPDIEKPASIIDEFREASENFYTIFEESVQELYLADFPSSFADKLKKAFDKERIVCSILKKKTSKPASLEDYSSTLIGLTAELFDV